jgi:GNAT superfamily N-acetyltransferase
MKKVQDTKDKNGEHVEIWVSPSIEGSPAAPLFLKVYAEMIEKGHGLNKFQFSGKDRAIWAQRNDGTILGGITYEYVSEKRGGDIVLAFTAPEARGLGINELCHWAWEDDCRSLGGKFITLFVNVNNESRIRSAEKVGMYPTYYKMYKDL